VSPRYRAPAQTRVARHPTGFSRRKNETPPRGGVGSESLTTAEFSATRPYHRSADHGVFTLKAAGCPRRVLASLRNICYYLNYVMFIT
jgi:hypothetical protein